MGGATEATLTTQLTTLVLVLPLVLAVAVSKLDVLAVTVGVPAILALVILTPVGSVLAVYTMPNPAALVATMATLLITTSSPNVAVESAAGELHVTTSGITVMVNARLVSCCCASVARIVKLYVVEEAVATVVPEITPVDEFKDTLVGNEPENTL